MNNLISVIVPIYNVENYLKQCIESIINQTYYLLEIILVDDGSNDKSGEICDDYCKKDARIKVIHHKTNLGTVRARKTGFLNSTGDVITFVDGDDWIEPKMYENLFDSMNKFKVDIVASVFTIEADYHSYVATIQLKRGIYGIKRTEFIDYIFKGFSTSANNKIFKRTIVKQHMMDIDDTIYGCNDDTVWVVPALLETDSFFYSNSSYYHYRMRNNSVTHKYSPLWLQKLNLVILHLYRCSERYKWSEEINRMIQYFINSSVIDGISHLSEGLLFPYYYIDIDERLSGKKIVLYGAGKVGHSLYQFLNKIKVCEVVSWVDKDNYKYKNAKGIDSIKNTEFDIILIGVLNETLASNIIQSLAKYRDKCLWIQPKSIVDYYCEQ